MPKPRTIPPGNRPRQRAAELPDVVDAGKTTAIAQGFEESFERLFPLAQFFEFGLRILLGSGEFLDLSIHPMTDLFEFGLPRGEHDRLLPRLFENPTQLAQPRASLAVEITVLLNQTQLAGGEHGNRTDRTFQITASSAIVEQLHGPRPAEQSHDLDMALEELTVPLELLREFVCRLRDGLGLLVTALQNELDFTYPSLGEFELRRQPLTFLVATPILGIEFGQSRFENTDSIPHHLELVRLWRPALRRRQRRRQQQ